MRGRRAERERDVVRHAKVELRDRRRNRGREDRLQDPRPLQEHRVDSGRIRCGGRRAERIRLVRAHDVHMSDVSLSPGFGVKEHLARNAHSSGELLERARRPGDPLAEAALGNDLEPDRFEGPARLLVIAGARLERLGARQSALIHVEG